MKKTGYPCLMALLMVALDRGAKCLAMGPLCDAGGSFPLIPGVLRLSYVENRGAAFGLLREHPQLLLVGTGLILAALLAYLLWRGPRLAPLPRWSLWLLLGGALGNWLDRLFLGYVVDFFQTLFIQFPVFNVADCCVTVGFALLAGWILLAKEARHG